MIVKFGLLVLTLDMICLVVGNVFIFVWMGSTLLPILFFTSSEVVPVIIRVSIPKVSAVLGKSWFVVIVVRPHVEPVSIISQVMVAGSLFPLVVTIVLDRAHLAFCSPEPTT